MSRKLSKSAILVPDRAITTTPPVSTSAFCTLGAIDPACEMSWLKSKIAGLCSQVKGRVCDALPSLGFRRSKHREEPSCQCTDCDVKRFLSVKEVVTYSKPVMEYREHTEHIAYHARPPRLQPLKLLSPLRVSFPRYSAHSLASMAARHSGTNQDGGGGGADGPKQRGTTTTTRKARPPPRDPPLDTTKRMQLFAALEEIFGDVPYALCGTSVLAALRGRNVLDSDTTSSCSSSCSSSSSSSCSSDDTSSEDSEDYYGYFGYDDVCYEYDSYERRHQRRHAVRSKVNHHRDWRARYSIVILCADSSTPRLLERAVVSSWQLYPDYPDVMGVPLYDEDDDTKKICPVCICSKPDDVYALIMRPLASRRETNLLRVIGPGLQRVYLPALLDWAAGAYTHSRQQDLDLDLGLDLDPDLYLDQHAYRYQSHHRRALRDDALLAQDILWMLRRLAAAAGRLGRLSPPIMPEVMNPLFYFVFPQVYPEAERLFFAAGLQLPAIDWKLPPVAELPDNDAAPAPLTLTRKPAMRDLKAAASPPKSAAGAVRPPLTRAQLFKPLPPLPLE